MSSIIFLTIELKLWFLLRYKSCVKLFVFIDLKIKTMNHALQFTDVAICLIDFCTGFICTSKSLIELFIQTIASLNQGLSLLIKNSNSCVLSETLLFPFGQCTIVLVDCALLPLSQFLVFSYWILDIFVFSLDSLVVHHCSIDIIFNFSDFGFFSCNINSNSFSLLLDLKCFVLFICILLLYHLKLIFKAIDYILLTLQLRFIIAL